MCVEGRRHGSHAYGCVVGVWSGLCWMGDISYAESVVPFNMEWGVDFVGSSLRRMS